MLLWLTPPPPPYPPCGCTVLHSMRPRAQNVTGDNLPRGGSNDALCSTDIRCLFLFYARGGRGCGGRVWAPWPADAVAPPPPLWPRLSDGFHTCRDCVGRGTLSTGQPSPAPQCRATGMAAGSPRQPPTPLRIEGRNPQPLPPPKLCMDTLAGGVAGSRAAAQVVPRRRAPWQGDYTVRTVQYSTAAARAFLPMFAYVSCGCVGNQRKKKKNRGTAASASLGPADRKRADGRRRRGGDQGPAHALRWPTCQAKIRATSMVMIVGGGATGAAPGAAPPPQIPSRGTPFSDRGGCSATAVFCATRAKKRKNGLPRPPLESPGAPRPSPATAGLDREVVSALCRRWHQPAQGVGLTALLSLSPALSPPDTIAQPPAGGAPLDSPSSPSRASGAQDLGTLRSSGGGGA